MDKNKKKKTNYIFEHNAQNTHNDEFRCAVVYTQFYNWETFKSKKNNNYPGFNDEYIFKILRKMYYDYYEKY